MTYTKLINNYGSTVQTSNTGRSDGEEEGIRADKAASTELRSWVRSLVLGLCTLSHLSRSNCNTNGIQTHIQLKYKQEYKLEYNHMIIINLVSGMRKHARTHTHSQTFESSMKMWSGAWGACEARDAYSVRNLCVGVAAGVKWGARRPPRWLPNSTTWLTNNSWHSSWPLTNSWKTMRRWGTKRE